MSVFFFADSLEPRIVPGTYQTFNEYSLKDELNEGINILACGIVVLRILMETLHNWLPPYQK